ncbi:MAG: PAS domain S-box-containing protein, partial [Candidatus Binatia bacterium]
MRLHGPIADSHKPPLNSAFSTLEIHISCAVPEGDFVISVNTASNAETGRRRTKAPPPTPGTSACRADNDRAPLFVLAITGLALSLLVFGLSLRTQALRVDAELARRAGVAANTLRPRLNAELARLATVTNFVNARDKAPHSEFNRFVVSQNATSNSGGTLGWAPEVTRESRDEFQDRIKAESGDVWQIRDSTADGSHQPAEDRPLHYPLATKPRNDEAGKLISGLDLAGIPTLRTVIDRAQNTRRLAIAPPSTLSGAQGSYLWAIDPVFDSSPGDSIGSQLAGFAVGVWSVKALIGPAFRERDNGSFGVDVIDATDDNAGEIIWSRKTGRVPGSVRPLVWLWQLTGGSQAHWNTSLSVGDRRWALAAHSGPRLLDATLTWTPWALLLSGLLLTSIAAAAMNFIQNQNRQLVFVRRKLERERRESGIREARLGEVLEIEKGERRRAEEGVFREKQQFRLMFNAVPAMIWYKDTKNRFLLVNESAARPTGQTVDEIEGKPCSEIFPERAYNLYRDDLEIIQSGRPKLGIEEKIENPDGKTLWVRTDKLPEYDAMGRVVGILVFSLEISEQREAKSEILRLNEELEERVVERTQQLARTDREMESFAYSVSHDLRTPLRSIDGFSHILLEEHGDEFSDGARSMLDRVRAASQLMGHLIDDLLTLTRVGRGSLRRESVDLSALAQTIAEDFIHGEPGRDVGFSIQESPLAVGDPTLLRTVMENLLGNAWKFTSKLEDAAHIEFGHDSTPPPDPDPQRNSGSGAFYVRDNGVGFDMVFA